MDRRRFLLISLAGAPATPLGAGVPAGGEGRSKRRSEDRAPRAVLAERNPLEMRRSSSGALCGPHSQPSG